MGLRFDHGSTGEESSSSSAVARIVTTKGLSFALLNHGDTHNTAETNHTQSLTEFMGEKNYCPSLLLGDLLVQLD